MTVTGDDGPQHAAGPAQRETGGHDDRGRRARPAQIAALIALLSAAFWAVGATAATARPQVDERYAPLTRPGPALTVPAKDLAASLHCEGQLRGSRLQPVLLSPGTTATPEDNFSWNSARAFRAQGRPFCFVAPPQRTMGDIQVAGEHLVYAIRTMHARAGRRVAVLGHSQGGMSMRWALRFWPDTRRMVDDVIGMAPPNQGTTAAAAACQPGVTRCVPALWQQDDGAAFIAALNSRAETFRGISYTNTFTRTDEEVQPSLDAETAASSLRTGDGRSPTSPCRTCARRTPTSTTSTAPSTRSPTRSFSTRSTIPGPPSRAAWPPKSA